MSVEDSSAKYISLTQYAAERKINQQFLSGLVFGASIELPMISGSTVIDPDNREKIDNLVASAQAHLAPEYISLTQYAAERKINQRFLSGLVFGASIELPIVSRVTVIDPDNREKIDNLVASAQAHLDVMGKWNPRGRRRRLASTSA